MKLSAAFEASIALSFGDVSDAYQFFPSTLGISDNPDYRANLQHCRITDIDYKRNHAGVSDHVPGGIETVVGPGVVAGEGAEMIGRHGGCPESKSRALYSAAFSDSPCAVPGGQARQNGLLPSA